MICSLNKTEMSIEEGGKQVVRLLLYLAAAAAVLEAEELHRLLGAVDGDDWMKHSLHELFRIECNLKHSRKMARTT